MTLDDYLKRLGWTGRQFRNDKKGQIRETWLDFVENFCLRFPNEAGLLTSRQAYRNRPRPTPSAQ